MNLNTYNKLKKNPHFKISDKQLSELEKPEKKPMITFGTPNIHDNHIEKHPVNVVKIDITKSNEKEKGTK